MSTPAQEAANKRNAQMSTGPRTDEGKARSSRNATSHGLRAECPVLEGLESQEAWAQHRDVYVEDLHPEGPVETQLAEKIASLNWRIGRAEAFLREVSSWGLECQVGPMLDLKTIPRSESHNDMDFPSRLRWLTESPYANQPLVKEILARAQRNAFPEGKLLDLIIRYTGSLERALNQAERKLEKLQDRRRAEEDRAERRADRALARGVEGRRSESKKLLEPAKIDPRDPEKGSAFEQEMDRLERQEPNPPPATPDRPRDLGSFGREAVKAEPVATSVASAAGAKVAALPAQTTQILFCDSKGRLKTVNQMNKREQEIVERAIKRHPEVLKPRQSPVAEVKVDPTSASSPIGAPSATV